jgi:hypothetical protein
MMAATGLSNEKLATGAVWLVYDSTELYNEAATRLATVVPDVGPYGDHVGVRIATWNNHDDTTKEMAVAKLREAAELEAV